MDHEPVTLGQLASVTSAQLVGSADIEIRDVKHDSQSAIPGDLFVAMRGSNRDGHDFVEGVKASAACVEELVDAAIPQIVVTDTRQALSVLASEVHGHPSHDLAVVGVTGTNGKTTVTYMLASIVESAGKLPGVVGTVGARLGTEQVEIERTSPEASDFQRLLAQMVGKAVDVAAVEVSSHALTFGRVGSTEFRVVAFTNLSQDHLDFHGNMDRYFEAKAGLFTSGSGPAVICIDDDWGRRLVDLTERPVITTGEHGEIRADNVVLGLEVSRFDLHTPEGMVQVDLSLAGGFNVSNALVAAGCGRALDIPLETIGAGLSGMGSIPGRMELVNAGQEFKIVVDYAHTPEGISEVVRAVKPMVAGRTLVVVGAGGDRDEAKRPAMGQAAAEADIAFITSDNPRSEDPTAIVAQVVSGAGDAGQLIVEPDRRAAIEQAVATAAAEDVVLILGRGHELKQELRGELLPFDDRAVAREAVMSL